MIFGKDKARMSQLITENADLRRESQELVRKLNDERAKVDERDKTIQEYEALLNKKSASCKTCKTSVKTKKEAK